MAVKIPPVLLAGIVLAVLAAAVAALMLVLARSSRREPSGLGLDGGRLRACPASPNCVSSEEGTDEAHRVAPLPAAASLEETRARLREALAACGDHELVVDEPVYLRATFRTSLFGFRDDVELRIDQAGGLVHVRSASRVGHSDLGANRARVERLRKAIEATP